MICPANTGRNGRGRRAVVRAAGTNALPTLLRMLRARDSGSAPRLAEWLQNQRLIHFNHVSAAQEQLQAVAGFRVLGGEARDAVPALIEIYEERNSPSSQSAAAEALGCIGPGARAAIPVLLGGMSNPDRRVRWTTLSALCQLQVEPAVLVPALIKSLGDSYAPVQRTAIQALGELSTDAISAVPALVDLLKYHNRGLRYLVGRALRQIDPEAADRAGLKQ